MQQEQINHPSEGDKLYAKFESLKDSLNGANDTERFDSFVQAQFAPGEAEFKKEVLAQVREKIYTTTQYSKDLEEVKNLYQNKQELAELAMDFWSRRGQFYNDPTLFLENRFGHYPEKIKEGYFYKEFIKKAVKECNEWVAQRLRFEKEGQGGVELIG